MKKEFLFLLSLFFLSSCLFDVVDNINEMKPIKHLDNWTLVWEDEFNDSIDLRYWSKIPRTMSNLGWQRYMSFEDSCYEIKDGALILKGIVNNFASNDTAKYLTGGVWTKSKKTISLGKVEIKAKMNKPHGTWPALWLLDANRKSPNNMGEIDIFESINAEDLIHQTIHTNYSLSTDQAFKSIIKVKDKESYNIYGVIINPEELIFLINNKITYIYPNHSSLIDQQQFPFGYGHEMYLILSMQLNNIDWTGHVINSQLPAKMYIDWVRFYEKKDASIPDY
ncbi:MAG TPA: glycoside hydrolase family 16 protein [Petrimonas sp.]|nr:glycoside hydrolase family 16 protein [Petrimonas sp.]